ncbi:MULTISPECIES: hypothetical protein [Candidatus Ichthyocystis]|uniref:Uncharacterized protein n=1 Tax=Candidatus Ichthyocystis hellenicum TaxID=1561003 RepID=A0A0S4M223_9BURK|nr:MULTISPECIES: hypothetical protein [Ichthyocystis]CUT17827.1 hypothetical protein Ark11_1008 [Candidatus Ichthyocystis hellenicum]
MYPYFTAANNLKMSDINKSSRIENDTSSSGVHPSFHNQCSDPDLNSHVDADTLLANEPLLSSSLDGNYANRLSQVVNDYVNSNDDEHQLPLNQYFDLDLNLYTHTQLPSNESLSHSLEITAYDNLQPYFNNEVDNSGTEDQLPHKQYFDLDMNQHANTKLSSNESLPHSLEITYHNNLQQYFENDTSNNDVSQKLYHSQYFDPSLNLHIDTLLENELLSYSLETSITNESNQYNSQTNTTVTENLVNLPSTTYGAQSDYNTAKLTIINDYEFNTCDQQYPTHPNTKRKFGNSKDRLDDRQSTSSKKHPSTIYIPDHNQSCYFTEPQYYTQTQELDKHLTSAMQQHSSFKNCDKFTIPNDLQILSMAYNYHDIFSDKYTSGIYEKAIKRISIDDNGSLRDSILANSILLESRVCIEEIEFLKHTVSLAPTYSRIRKYICGKFSQYINRIMHETDVLLAPGMNVSDMKTRCTSNSVFFYRLSRYCKKIMRDINKIPHEKFSNLIQDRIFFNSTIILTSSLKKIDICMALKQLLLDTISSLPQRIIYVIGNYDSKEMTSGLFSFCHGAHVSKSLIRKTVSIYNSINEKIEKDKPLKNDFNDYEQLFDQAIAELKEWSNTSFFLHNGIVFSPNDSTVKLITAYLLSDITEASYNTHYKALNENKIESPILDNCNLGEKNEKRAAVNMYRESTSSLNKYITAVPTNIYKIALSMISIDEGNFSSAFIDKTRSLKSVKNYISELSKRPEPNLVATYSRLRGYIVESITPFLDKIEAERLTEIKLYNGMTLEEFRNAHISNNLSLDKLNWFCSEIAGRMEKKISRVIDKTPWDNISCTLIQSYVSLVGSKLKVAVSDKVKRTLNEDILMVLSKNVCSIPEKIANLIRSLPKPVLVEGYFSPFCDVYVDNKSLLKVKLVFNAAQEMVENDEVLFSSSRNICNHIREYINQEIDEHVDVTKNDHLDSIIDNYIISGDLSTHGYIKILVRELVDTKLKTILESNEPIIIKNSSFSSKKITLDDKMVIAEGEARDNLFIKFELYIMELALNSYRNLCIKRSGISSV